MVLPLPSPLPSHPLSPLPSPLLFRMQSPAYVCVSRSLYPSVSVCVCALSVPVPVPVSVYATIRHTCTHLRCIPTNNEELYRRRTSTTIPEQNLTKPVIAT